MFVSVKMFYIDPNNFRLMLENSRYIKSDIVSI